MRIVVLAGGLSNERDVSLVSGSLIANALIDNSHEVVLVDLYMGIEDCENWSEVFVKKSDDKHYDFSVPECEPDLDKLRSESGNGDSLIGPNVLEICKYADKVFIGLHGSIGENGQIQAVFDTLGIKYTGTGYVGSLLAMDKDISKKLMIAAGVPTPTWHLVNFETEELVEFEEFNLPCIIKPCSNGSSIGVSIVNSLEEFGDAINVAAKYEDNILVEKMIIGREFSVGILGGMTLPPIEIIPKEGFYDYKNKYQEGATIEVCPAEIDAETSDRLKTAALKAHKALRLGFYSRIDFMLDEVGEIYCLEANTLPGMTPTSLLPQEAASVGISYNQLCEAICNEEV
jgi:D-alanine-D-alanine ligase